MPINPDIINVFMQTILGQMDGGFSLIYPHVIFLFRALLIITIVFHGLRVAYSDEPFFNALMMRMIYIGFFVYLITNWKNLTEIVFKSFTMLGIQAGGSAITIADIVNPAKVAKIGLDLFIGLLQHSLDLSGTFGFITNAPAILAYLLAAVVVLACFIIMAIQIFIAVVSFKAVTLAAFILIPFGLWKGTGFLAERSIGYVFSAGIRLMVLAIVISLGSTLFASITLGPSPSYQEAAGAVMGSLTFLVFAFYAPALASDLVTGGPSLGAGAALATAAPVAGASMAVASAGAGLALSAGRAAISAMTNSQRAQQIMQAASAGMGGGGLPPSGGPYGGGAPGGGSFGGGGIGMTSSPAAKPAPTVTAADMARHYDPNKNSRSSGGGGATASTLSTGGLRGEGKTPAPRPAATASGSARQTGLSYPRSSLLAEMRATRDGDGGGGMQPSIKHPDEET